MDVRFLWQERHSVGVQQFDSDHRRLLELAHTMVNKTLAGPLPVLPGDVLNDLIERAEEHFAHEERLMATTEYEGLEDHRLAHRRLMTDIRRYQKDLNAGTVVPDEVARFVAAWLFTHIDEEDRRYGEHLNGRGYR